MRNNFKLFKSGFILKLFFGSLLTALFFTSCEPQTVEIPKDVLPRDSMVQVMADLQMAESRLLIGGGSFNRVDMRKSYIWHILQKNNVDTAMFGRSFRFYSTNPELFSEMYDQVITEISKRQAEKK